MYNRKREREREIFTDCQIFSASILSIFLVILYIVIRRRYSKKNTYKYLSDYDCSILGFQTGLL